MFLIFAAQFVLLLIVSATLVHVPEVATDTFMVLAAVSALIHVTRPRTTFVPATPQGSKGVV